MSQLVSLDFQRFSLTLGKSTRHGRDREGPALAFLPVPTSPQNCGDVDWLLETPDCRLFEAHRRDACIVVTLVEERRHVAAAGEHFRSQQFANSTLLHLAVCCAIRSGPCGGISEMRAFFPILFALGLAGLTCTSALAAYCDVPKVCIIQTLRTLKEQCQGEARRLYQVSANQTKGCPRYFTLTYTDYEGQESRNITADTTEFKTCGKPRQVMARYECPKKPSKNSATEGASLPSSGLDGRTISYSYQECASKPCSRVSGRISISGNEITSSVEGGKTVRSKNGAQILDTTTDTGANGWKSRSDNSMTARWSGSRISIEFSTRWNSHLAGRLVSEGTSSGRYMFEVVGNTCRIASSGTYHQTNFAADGKIDNLSGPVTKVANVRCEVR